MSNNKVFGIIFANVHDELIPSLTEKRSMASIPFGARYRLIDFSLSNLVNAGISKVGIITKENYQSLMDHLGSGKPWDLDRKSGGIFMLPPYSTNRSGFFRGHVDALAGVITFLKRSQEEYVIMCDSDVIGNIDLKGLIKAHNESGADVTAAYKKGKLPNNHKDIMTLKMDPTGRITDIDLAQKQEEDADYCLDIFIMRRALLIDLVEIADKRRHTSLSRDVFIPNVKSLNMHGYKVEEFAEVVESEESYVRISHSLRNAEVRKQLFNSERPIYTKVRDDMPTRYGLNSKVSGSVIADGCVIEGTVKNSILFRGVKVAAGAVVEDCIVMQGTVIGENCQLKNVTIDKAAILSNGVVLHGKPDKNIFIGKEKTV